MSADRLREAINQLADVDTASRELAKLAIDLESRRVAAEDLAASKMATFDDLSSERILESGVSAAEVDAARAESQLAAEAVRALSLAISKVTRKIDAHVAVRDRALENLNAARAAVAEPLVSKYRAAVVEHAEALAKALRLTHLTDEAARLGSGFLTGSAAEQMAGNPAEILRGFGFDAVLSVTLSERADRIKSAELLALAD